MFTHNDIIEKLKNDYEYYAGMGKAYLSNSDIGLLLANPKGYGKQRGDNKNFAAGRYFHQSLIEPDKVANTPFVDVSSRNTKEYKNYCETNNYEFVLLKKEIEEVDKLVSIIKSNILFFEAIYKEGNQYELPAVGDIKGLMWKGKADIVCDDMIIDLKTTSDINKFKYSAKAYNYDSQCYIYQKLFGKPLVFFVIDKESGQLGIFRPTETFVANGERKVERAVEVYNRYFGQNPTDNIDNHYIDETLD
jgi:hypothetical protein